MLLVQHWEILFPTDTETLERSHKQSWSTPNGTSTRDAGFRMFGEALAIMARRAVKHNSLKKKKKLREKKTNKLLACKLTGSTKPYKNKKKGCVGLLAEKGFHPLKKADGSI